MTGRRWLGEAQAAFDQGLAQLPPEAAFGRPDLWLQRAQIAAQIASAEQARIANLIAWKALRQAASTSTSTLPNAGDAIADEIEASLGIDDAGSDPLAAIREQLARLHGVDLGDPAQLPGAVAVLEEVATLAGYAAPGEEAAS